MNHLLNDLSARAANWLMQEPMDAVWAARGWAIGEQLRRLGFAEEEVVERVEARLRTYPSDMSGGKPRAGRLGINEAVVAEVLESARGSVNRLLGVLDSVDEGAAEFEGTARETFFEVLEALLIAEAGRVGDEAGQRLFNQVVADLYAFEPVADCACALRTNLVGKVGLADLFCAGVAGYAEAEGRIMQPARVERAAEDFVDVAELVMAGGAGGHEMLPLDELAKRLGRSAWYFLKWGVHRVKLVVQPAARALRLEVHEAAGGLSRGMDGWEVQVRGLGKAVVRGGVATVKLAEHVEARGFVVEVRRSSEEEWGGLFGRVGG